MTSNRSKLTSLMSYSGRRGVGVHGETRVGVPLEGGKPHFRGLGQRRNIS